MARSIPPLEFSVKAIFADQSLRDIERKVNQFKREIESKPLMVKVQVDESNTRQTIANVNRSIEQVKVLKLNLDTSGIDAKLAEIDRKLSQTRTVTVKADFSDFNRQLSEAEQKLSSLSRSVGVGGVSGGGSPFPSSTFAAASTAAPSISSSSTQMGGASGGFGGLIAGAMLAGGRSSSPSVVNSASLFSKNTKYTPVPLTDDMRAAEKNIAANRAEIIEGVKRGIDNRSIYDYDNNFARKTREYVYEDSRSGGPNSLSFTPLLPAGGSGGAGGAPGFFGRNFPTVSGLNSLSGLKRAIPALAAAQAVTGVIDLAAAVRNTYSADQLYGSSGNTSYFGGPRSPTNLFGLLNGVGEKGTSPQPFDNDPAGASAGYMNQYQQNKSTIGTALPFVGGMLTSTFESVMDLSGKGPSAINRMNVLTQKQEQAGEANLNGVLSSTSRAKIVSSRTSGDVASAIEQEYQDQLQQMRGISQKMAKEGASHENIVKTTDQLSQAAEDEKQLKLKSYRMQSQAINSSASIMGMSRRGDVLGASLASINEQFSQSTANETVGSARYNELKNLRDEQIATATRQFRNQQAMFSNSMIGNTSSNYATIAGDPYGARRLEIKAAGQNALIQAKSAGMDQGLVSSNTASQLALLDFQQGRDRNQFVAGNNAASALTASQRGNNGLSGQIAFLEFQRKQEIIAAKDKYSGGNEFQMSKIYAPINAKYDQQIALLKEDRGRFEFASATSINSQMNQQRAINNFSPILAQSYGIYDNTQAQIEAQRTNNPSFDATMRNRISKLGVLQLQGLERSIQQRDMGGIAREFDAKNVAISSEKDRSLENIDKTLEAIRAMMSTLTGAATGD